MKRLFPPAWLRALITGGGARTPQLTDVDVPSPPDGAPYTWRDDLLRAMRHVTQRAVTRDEAESLLHEIDSAKLIALDQRLRSGIWDRSAARSSVGKVSLMIPAGDGARAEAQLFVVACSASGFLRERALREFAKHPGRLAWAAALIRCGDWVPQIRECALESMAQLQKSDQGEALFKLLGLVERLRGWRRVTGAIWDTRIERELLAPEHRAARWEALSDPEPSARAFALSLVLRADPDRTAEALVHAVDDNSPGIARRALLQARGTLSEGAFLEPCRHAVGHCHAAIRADAIRTLAELNVPDLHDVARGLLFDPARAPREAAAHLWSKRFDADPRSLWREAVDGDDSAHREASLQALSDAPEPQDLSRFDRFRRHPRARVRLTALRGLVRLKDARLPELLAEALCDSAVPLVREAIHAYAQGVAFLDARELHAAIAGSANPRVQAGLIQSAHNLGKWESLLLLLRLARSENPSTAALAIGQLAVWVRRSNQRFTPLSHENRQPLIEELDAARSALSDGLWESLVRFVGAA